MSKKKVNKKFLLFAVIVMSIGYLLIFTIPLGTGRKLKQDIVVSEHILNTKKFILPVVKGNNYTVSVTTSTFWSLDVHITLYRSSVMLMGQRVDSASLTGDSFSFTAKKTGRYYVIIGGEGSGFFDVVFTNGSSTTSSPITSNFNVGKFFLIVTPAAVWIPFTILINRRLVKKEDKSDGTEHGEELEYDYPEMCDSTPLTILKSPEERVEDLKKIIGIYKSISLEEMADLLDFGDKMELQEWIIDLPDDIIKFKIDSGRIIIPEELHADSDQAQASINKLAENLSEYQIQTCFYCGEPLDNDSNNCSQCGKEVLICSVCKLPISFGSDIGRCPHCDTASHIKHVQEWLKVKGNCPKCQQKITADQIICFSSKNKK